MIATRTTPAMTVRPRDWKIAPIDASCWCSLRRAKSLSRLPEQPRRAAALQPAAVGRHRIAECEIDQAGKQVGLDAGPRPSGILQRNPDGAEEIEQADDQHQRSVLEETDEGVHQRRV